MKKNMHHFALQLKETCQLTGAHWATWLRWTQNSWEYDVHYRLNNTRRAALEKYIRQPKETTWLAGALSSGRSRFCHTGVFASKLNCRRLYAFPNIQSHFTLLVGADQLNKAEQGFYKILALDSPVRTDEAVPAEEHPEDLSHLHLETSLFEIDLANSFDPPELLGKVLIYLTKFVPCEAAYLSIRSGNLFRVEAIWNYPERMKGATVSTDDDPDLAEIITSRRGKIITVLDQFTLPESNIVGRPLWLIDGKPAKSRMGVPVIIGQRVIGYISLASTQPRAFTTNHLDQASHQSDRFAFVIENAIVFNEATRYLQQQALLNELASAASMSAEVHDVSRRIMQRLSRVFRTDQVSIYLVNPEDGSLHEYGSEPHGSHKPKGYDSNAAILAVQSGTLVKNSDTQHLTRKGDSIPPAQSVLAVPLKYRGKVIGALLLESTEHNAFSQQDEQLLIVIASHLAGLFENIRLNEETRERADKLQDTVLQLQAVRETSLDIASDLDFNALLKRIVKRVCELVDASGAELALLDEKESTLRVLVSEAPWPERESQEIPLMAGVAGQVAAFGEPLVVSDYNSWNGRLNPQEKAPFRTVAGVPLKFQGKVIGTLSVMDDRSDKVFHSEDIQLLELLAPQVTIWIRNARLYQELQERIEAQQLAESRLVRSARLAAVGEMAAGVAHELNNPLTIVIGFVELALEESPPDSPINKDLKLVLKEAQRAKDVVRRLLDFSKPSERQRLPTNLNTLVHEVLNLLQYMIHNQEIEVVLDLEDLLPQPPIDPDQIKQVFINLIHNALQAMAAKGTLFIKTAQLEQEGRNWVTVIIKDSGTGILPENLERIFEPFFTTRTPGEGTGLGLSVSYGIITDHGGFIDAQSQPGLGSCFTVFLPLEGNAG